MFDKKGAQNAVLVSVLVVGIVGLFFAFSVPLGPDYSTIGEVISPAGPQTVAFAVNKLTGQFATPAAKSYGGEIKGISDSSSRAFSGRAIETDIQNCYTCSCHDVKLTAATRENAQVACKNNCGGTIISESQGPCR